MTDKPVISRRSLLAAFWLAGTSSVWAQVKRGGDQGIGGTGITGGDHGIGGTGIVGVIQRFGSIYVNGERVSYAADVPVRIDGEPASVKALRIGHVARVLAYRQANGGLTTHAIDAVSEVSGPIESVKSGEMSVLGQRVIWAGKEGWRKPGAHVAVFGLRRIDGAIVASLVEPRREKLLRVTGPLERDRNDLRIGGLRLLGADASLAGRRVQVEGRVAQGGLQVVRTKLDDFSNWPGASRLSIEAYVRRDGDNLQFGSGYIARDASRFMPSTNGEARVVVNADFDTMRGLRVESVQTVDRFPGATMRGPGGPDRGGGGPGGPAGPGGGVPGGPSGPGGPSSPGGAPPGFPGGGGSGPPGFPGGGPAGPGGGLGGPGGGGFPGGPGGGGFGGGGRR